MAVRIYPLAPTDVQPYDQGGKIRRSRRMRPRPPGAVTEYVPAPASDAAQRAAGGQDAQRPASGRWSAATTLATVGRALDTVSQYHGVAGPRRAPTTPAVGRDHRPLRVP